MAKKDKTTKNKNGLGGLGKGLGALIPNFSVLNKFNKTETELDKTSGTEVSSPDADEHASSAQVREAAERKPVARTKSKARQEAAARKPAVKKPAVKKSLVVAAGTEAETVKKSLGKNTGKLARVESPISERKEHGAKSSNELAEIPVKSDNTLTTPDNEVVKPEDKVKKVENTLAQVGSTIGKAAIAGVKVDDNAVVADTATQAISSHTFVNTATQTASAHASADSIKETTSTHTVADIAAQAANSHAAAEAASSHVLANISEEAAAQTANSEPSLQKDVPGIGSERSAEEVGAEFSAQVTEQILQASDKQYLYVDISNVIPNKEQPRRQFSEESLQSLAASIKDVGLLQPVLVQKISKHGKHDVYQIVAGERRWRAAQRANLTQLPVLILQDNLDPVNLLKEAIIENVQRENLNPIEEAEAYRKLADEFNLSQAEIAVIGGKSRPTISNMQRLLKLPEQVKKYLINGDLSIGQARPLLQIEDVDSLCKLAEIIVKEGLSARQVESKVRELVSLQEDGEAAGGADKELSAEERAVFEETERLQRKLTSWFGQQVQIKQQKGRGKLIVSFNDYDELDTILEKFGIKERL